jgi:predicted transcriptional regulator
MPLSTTPQSTEPVSTEPDGSTVDPETVIALLSDDHARTILETIQDEPKSARSLANVCDVSRPTVYRRLERLQAAGLVTTRMEYDDDGHHRRRFEALVDTVDLALGDAGFEVAVDAGESAPVGSY